MRDAARTIAVSAAPAAVTGVLWLRLEAPAQEAGRAVSLVLLALAAAAVGSRAVRGAAALAAAGIALRAALGIWPWHPVALATRFGHGVGDFYAVHLPFDPHAEPRMRGVVLLAAFAFVIVVALLAAARKPVLAVLGLVLGAGWPATLVGPSHALLAGGAILLAALVLVAGSTELRLARVAIPVAAAVVAAAVAVASSPAAARQGLVAWQTWNPYPREAPPVSVAFVWNSQYLGLHWPRKRTTVLEVAAPPTASLYWRAALLDDFAGDGWVGGRPRRADALEPPAAFRRRNETPQTVTIAGLADTRLVGGSVPVQFDAGRTPVSQPVPGTAFVLSGLTRGFRYTVWSYAPQPTATQLQRSPARYPSLLASDGLLDVWPGVTMPAFGTRDRPGRVRALLDRHPEVEQYAPLARLAGRVAGRARTPYAATVALEQWFRATGGFRYSNDPHAIFPNPLVAFVTRTRAGYCQYFAGAMALMLRYLGVPARVAVGFSSGTYDLRKGAWVVTDHDAHAWVEAWFAGYGWLPFDPTPSVGRPEQGTLSAPYSSSSPGFGLRPGSKGAPVQRGQRGAGRTAGGAKTATSGGAGGTVATPSSHAVRDAFLAVLALVAATLAAILATKLTVRAVRRATRDPRRVAAACRGELAAFLLDQRIDAARSATLHELGALLRGELAVDPDRFVAAATAARFGRPDGARSAAHAARRELRLLLRSVRNRLTGRERLRGFLSLRSLGLEL